MVFAPSLLAVYSRTLDKPVGKKIAHTVAFSCSGSIIDIDGIKHSIMRAYNCHAPRY